MNSRAALVTAGILVVGLGLGAFFASRLRPSDTPTWDGRAVPQDGLVLNPEGRNLGDPEHAVRDFRRVYAAMDAFRRQHARLPSLAELTNFSQPLAGGFQLREEDFKIPDQQYSDRYNPASKNLHYMFAYREPRPDGTSKPAFPRQSERDVWLVCVDYIRQNQRVHRNLQSEVNLQGVYVVLWSDGKVEKVPLAESLTRHLDDRRVELGFKGQTGMPKGTKTLRQHYETKDGIKIVDKR